MALRCLSARSVGALRRVLEREGLSPETAEELAWNMFPCTVLLEGLHREDASRLMDRVQTVGGHAHLVPFVGLQGNDLVSILISGPSTSILRLNVADCLVESSARHRTRLLRRWERLGDHVWGRPPPAVQYRGKRLDFSKGPILMGVLNVTPDSFYDGGRYLDRAEAVRRARKLIEEGADILDIGGASSRPGAELVSARTQRERVLPVIEEIRRHWDGWISVDTYTSEVAREALDRGADMINDISAGNLDPEMKEVVRTYGAPCVLMHMKGTPRDMQTDPSYDALIADVISSLEDAVEEWSDAGVSRDRILVDPGIGFGKTVQDNLSLLNRLRDFAILGRPVVLGTSRKSFIGAVLKQEAPDRLIGTLAANVIGAVNGAHVFRVHDVFQARSSLTMARAVMEA